MGSTPGHTKCEHQTNSRPTSARLFALHMLPSRKHHISLQKPVAVNEQAGPTMQAALDAPFSSARLDARGAFWVANVLLSSLCDGCRCWLCWCGCCAGRFKPTLDLIPGVTLGHLKEHKQGDLLSGFQSLFAGKAPDSAAAGGKVLHCRVCWQRLISCQQL